MKVFRFLAFMILFPALLILEVYLIDNLYNLAEGWLGMPIRKDAIERLLLMVEISQAARIAICFSLGLSAALLLPINKTSSRLIKFSPLILYYLVWLAVALELSLSDYPFNPKNIVHYYQPQIIAFALCCPAYLVGLRLGMPLFLKLQPIWIRVTGAKPAAMNGVEERVIKEMAANPGR